jgi:hypothetical protein
MASKAAPTTYNVGRTQTETIKRRLKKIVAVQAHCTATRAICVHNLGVKWNSFGRGSLPDVQLIRAWFLLCWPLSERRPAPPKAARLGCSGGSGHDSLKAYLVGLIRRPLARAINSHTGSLLKQPELASGRPHLGTAGHIPRACTRRTRPVAHSGPEASHEPLSLLRDL